MGKADCVKIKETDVAIALAKLIVRRFLDESRPYTRLRILLKIRTVKHELSEISDTQTIFRLSVPEFFGIDLLQDLAYGVPI